jgi:hypothetical protein
MLATKNSGGKGSWRDEHGVLLDNHCKQLHHHSSRCLICIGSVVREGNEPLKEDQAQSFNHGERIMLLLVIFPLMQVVLSSRSRWSFYDWHLSVTNQKCESIP